MGVVYLARQSGPVERTVAIKVIACGEEGTAARAAYVTRFRAECRTLSRLEHSNIARVYDAGAVAKGDPYLVMELLEGEPLTDLCDHRQLTVPERLWLLAEVCRGVHFAHQKGVIHRDLKPSNILVVEEAIERLGRQRGPAGS
jgi:serine/threonine protein kinase